MEPATSTKLQEWTRVLRDVTFPTLESFNKFLASVGVSPEQMEFDPVQGRALALNDMHSVVPGKGLHLTGHGIELLAKSTSHFLIKVIVAAETAGAVTVLRHQNTAEEIPYPFAFDRRVPLIDQIDLARIPLQATEPPRTELARAPQSIEDITGKPAENSRYLLTRISGMHPELSLADIANRELGRRQLHLRALTEAMHEAGFTDYSAQDAFYLACICTEQVTVSEPLIFSSTRVASLSLPPTGKPPSSSTSARDAYTYFNTDIFGYSFSFGFTQYTQFDLMGNTRKYSVCFPIIGIDDKLLREIQELDKKVSGEPMTCEELFTQAMQFVWSGSTLEGHDHIHAIVTDLTLSIPQSPFAMAGLAKTLSSIRERYNDFNNETHATTMQAVAFNVMHRRNPEIRAAVFRQTLQFIDTVAELSARGLSDDAATHLLFVGFTHIRGITPLDEGLIGDSETIMEHAEKRFPRLAANQQLATLQLKLRGSLAYSTCHEESFEPPKVLTALSELSFSSQVANLTASHVHYMLRLLHEQNVALRDFVATDGSLYSTLGALENQKTFVSQRLPIRTSEPIRPSPIETVAHWLKRARSLIS